MKGLVLLLGESFRFGNQNTSIRGIPQSLNGQIEACNSHIKFIKKFNCDVFIATYDTQYRDQLLGMYPNLIGAQIYSNLVGIHKLFHDSLTKINKEYDFILYIRIDLFLKDYFIEIFDPTWSTIHFTSIMTEAISYMHKGHPRVNDMMFFIPKKYFEYLYLFGENGYPRNLDQHSQWQKFIEKGLTYKDMDVMIDMFHNPNSAGQENPLYYIVNRPISNENQTKGYLFNKYEWYGVKT
jgi:hypothetical protein